MYFLFLSTFTFLMFRCFLLVFVSVFLYAIAYSQPNASFSFTEVCLGNTTQFTNQSTATAPDTIVSWNWNFDDGSNAATLQNPAHTYSSFGVYEVRLIVTTVSGLRDTVINEVEVHPVPDVSITASPFTGCQPLTIDFTSNTSIDTSGSIAGWLWDFDDGATSTQQNPTHTYWELFIHTVHLTVTSNKGCTDSTTRDIFVLQNPVCDFTASLISLNDSSPIVNFTNLSSGGNIDLLWDFGDGTSSTEYSLQHTYDTCGSYNVVLTATGTNTCVTVANYILEVCDTLVQIYNGVGEEQSISFKEFIVFPSPSNGELINVNYELENEESVSCFVTDISGRLVAAPFSRRKQSAGKYSFELKENLSPGIYFFTVDVSGRMYSRRFVVIE
ncbi:MAG: PKD domain-containing protein [Bacteroidia bacterium]